MAVAHNKGIQMKRKFELTKTFMMFEIKQFFFVFHGLYQHILEF